jgi:hypothetical protein
MRLISKTGLLALIAVFAVSAAAASAASAATPEFKPVPTKKKFKGTGSLTKLTFNNGTEVVECEKSSTSGEVLGARTIGKVVVVFSNCKTSGTKGSGCPVNSAGAHEGEIVTKPLGGELGTVAAGEAPSGVGVLLKPEAEKTWAQLAESKCLPATKITGTLAAEVAVIGKKQLTNRLVFAASGTKQAIATIKLDSGVQEHPELVMFSSTLTLASSDELTFEEALEVT